MRRGPKRKRLSPQEKKAMSLKKDRRADWYGYETKGVRSKSRARSHQVARREDKRLLVDDPDAAEAAFRLKQRRRWRKYAGETVGDHIANMKAVRVARHGARLRRRARWQ